MSSQTDSNIILYHQGPVAFETITELIYKLKVVMKKQQARQVTYKKILMLMIESLENILKYHEYFDHNDFLLTNHSPVFCIEKEGDSFIISSGNPVMNSDVPELEKRILHLNGLNKEGVKKLYKSTITDGRFSDKGGAGLGIIEMAKISDKKIDYAFKPIDNKYSYYSVRLVIND
jgi:hypothetical protein